MKNSLMNLRYQASITSALALAKKWSDNAPDNKDVQELVKDLLDVSIYNAGLEMERREFSFVIEELRADKNRAVIRARRAEDVLEPVSKELAKVKRELKLFI